MMKVFSTLVNLYMAGMETSSNLQIVFMEAMRKVQEKTATYMEGEISPDKYKHFYNVWMETYSETFKEFSKSGHFVSDIGKLNSYLMDFQKYNREIRVIFDHPDQRTKREKRGLYKTERSANQR